MVALDLIASRVVSPINFCMVFFQRARAMRLVNVAPDEKLEWLIANREIETVLLLPSADEFFGYGSRVQSPSREV
jgi:hypothetical protein